MHIEILQLFSFLFVQLKMPVVKDVAGGCLQRTYLPLKPPQWPLLACMLADSSVGQFYINRSLISVFFAHLVLCGVGWCFSWPSVQPGSGIFALAFQTVHCSMKSKCKWCCLADSPSFFCLQIYWSSDVIARFLFFSSQPQSSTESRREKKADSGKGVDRETCLWLALQFIFTSQCEECHNRNNARFDHSMVSSVLRAWVALVK